MRDYRKILQDVQNERLSEIEVYNRSSNGREEDLEEAAATLRAIYLYRQDVHGTNLAKFVEETENER